jgi:acetoacetate decarboxylase
MQIEDVKANAFAMPFSSPSFPVALPFHRSGIHDHHLPHRSRSAVEAS